MKARLILLALLGTSLAALAGSGDDAYPLNANPASSAALMALPGRSPAPAPAATVHILVLADGSVRVTPSR